MRGIKSEDLVAMVDFLCYGGANVNQESLDSFLALAEEMPLKGLTGLAENSAKVTEHVSEKHPEKKTSVKKQHSMICQTLLMSSKRGPILKGKKPQKCQLPWSVLRPTI